jgi:DNA-binding XRE family transcriptional regulator
MSARTRTATNVIFKHSSGTCSMLVDPDAAKAAMALLERFIVPQGQDEAPVDAKPFAARVTAKAGGAAALALKVSRRNKGMTQREVADAAGMRQAHLSAMETGKRSVSAKTAKRLAGVLGCGWRRLMTAPDQD